MNCTKLKVIIIIFLLQRFTTAFKLQNSVYECVQEIFRPTLVVYTYHAHIS